MPNDPSFFGLRKARVSKLFHRLRNGAVLLVPADDFDFLAFRRRIEDYEVSDYVDEVFFFQQPFDEYLLRIDRLAAFFDMKFGKRGGVAVFPFQKVLALGSDGGDPCFLSRGRYDELVEMEEFFVAFADFGAPDVLVPVKLYDGFFERFGYGRGLTLDDGNGYPVYE